MHQTFIFESFSIAESEMQMSCFWRSTHTASVVVFKLKSSPPPRLSSPPRLLLIQIIWDDEPRGKVFTPAWTSTQTFQIQTDLFSQSGETSPFYTALTWPDTARYSVGKNANITLMDTESTLVKSASWIHQIFSCILRRSKIQVHSTINQSQICD